MLLTAFGLLSGCAAAPERPTVSLPSPQPRMAMGQSSTVSSSRDAAAAVPTVFHVEVYLFSVPDGTYANNEAFWKRIDEQCFDPGTSEVLQNNGIRAGLAPLSEIEHFAQFLDQVTPVQKITVAGMEMKDAQIPMRKEIPEQIIFHFNRSNALSGTKYDKSENILNISFEPAPRKPGQVRLTFCPMVRTLRKQLQVTQMNEAYEIQFVSPEKLYDLNFRVDLPTTSFLIITPSPQASNLVSVGNAFFINDAPAERQEQVMLIVAEPYRVRR
jgi:hypothetical protein